MSSTSGPPLRIAQVSPLTESVPPKLYGGTERVVSTLTEGLVSRGHHVTLFASGDSRTRARLIAPCPTALRLSGDPDPLSTHMLMLEMVAKQADEFDLIHFHIAPLHFSVARRLKTAHVTTLHGRLDLSQGIPLFEEFRDLPLVSVSDAQRDPLERQNWVATIYHGLPSSDLGYHEGSGDYLAFLGRISPEKRVDRAIAIALACKVPLKIAAKVDPADTKYFREQIEPLLRHPLVDYIGEIGESDKGSFLGDARALLFPIDWPEPFGLVMIEAMACGTPVVAFRRGSVPEVIEDGLTGYVVDDLEQAIAATCRIAAIDRAVCRREFERRFTAARMTDDYVRIYRRLATESRDGQD